MTKINHSLILLQETNNKINQLNGSLTAMSRTSAHVMFLGVNKSFSANYSPSSCLNVDILQWFCSNMDLRIYSTHARLHCKTNKYLLSVNDMIYIYYNGFRK